MDLGAQIPDPLGRRRPLCQHRAAPTTWTCRRRASQLARPTRSLWDKSTGKRISHPSVLHRDRRQRPDHEGDAAGVIASLQCREEKARRGRHGPPATGSRPSRRTCSRSARRWRHRPSKDKSSGLTFHYPPYAVGPYAEGGYVAFVPSETLKPYLSAEGARIFGGTRPKADPTTRTSIAPLKAPPPPRGGPSPPPFTTTRPCAWERSGVAQSRLECLITQERPASRTPQGRITMSRKITRRTFVASSAAAAAVAGFGFKPALGAGLSGTSGDRDRALGRRRRHRRDRAHRGGAAGEGPRPAVQRGQPHRRLRRGRPFRDRDRTARRLHHRHADGGNLDDALAGAHRTRTRRATRRWR